MHAVTRSRPERNRDRHAAAATRWRRITASAVLTGLVIALLPASPATAATWFNETFDGGVPEELGDGWGWNTTGAGHAGPGLRTRMPEGEHWGASGHIEMSEIGHGGTDELYWRYWLRLDPDFYIEPPNRGKLPGPAGLYTYNCLGGRTSTPSEPCWSARTLFSRTYPTSGYPGYPNGPDDVTQLGSYVYHLDGPDNRGEIILWDDDTAQLEHGRWYCVEGRVRMNTPGARNGVLQNWVDGDLAFDRTDLRFRRSSETSIHVKSFWMDVYHGGGPSAADNDVLLDSLALGSSRLGCGDGIRFDGSFRDDDTSPHQADIEWLAAAGVTKGCNPPTNDRFCPNDSVTRGQMAAFLDRALGLPDGKESFRDVASDHTFAASIGALAQAGITKGCNPPTNDRFCPGAPVTRGEMAAFLQRAYDLPDGTARFTDTAGSPFASAIAALADAGVTKGCNPPTNDRFCPRDPVTRGQMASFLRRAEAT